jgi:hypothetical protein
VQQPDAIGTTTSLRLGKPAGVSLIPSTDTHWTRILYYDLFTGADDSTVGASELAGATNDFRTPSSRETNREIFVAAKGSSRDVGSRRTRSPFQATVVMLGICVAMYLAVWLALRAMTASDAAAAIVPASSMAQSVLGGASRAPTGVGESPSSDWSDEVSEAADSAGGCRPGAATDSMSVSD